MAWWTNSIGVCLDAARATEPGVCEDLERLQDNGDARRVCAHESDDAAIQEKVARTIISAGCPRRAVAAELVDRVEVGADDDDFVVRARLCARHGADDCPTP